MTENDTDNLLVWRLPSGEELIIDANGSVTKQQPSEGYILNRVGALVDQIHGLRFLLHKATGEQNLENRAAP